MENKHIELNLKFHSSCPICNSSEIRNIGLRYNSSQGIFPCRKGTMALSVYRCKICDVLFANPMPTNIMQFYEAENPDEYFKTIYRQGEAIKRWHSIWNFIKSHVNTGRALDIGAGTGIMTRWLAQHFEHVVAVEPSKVFFEKLKDRFIDFDNVSLIKATFEEFCQHYVDNKFDFIFLHEVLEHVPDPLGMLKLSLKVVKPDGVIYICVPNNRWLTYDTVKSIYVFTGKCFTPHLAPLHSPYHLYEFSKSTFKKIAKMLSLDIIAMRTRYERTYIPKPLHYPFMWLSQVLDKGYEVEVLLKKSA